jgi:chitin disaccharide deacetylase
MKIRQPITLIVNADDYGYFDCVSQGIVEAAHSGVLSAIGILPNSPNLQARLKWLENSNNLDFGVHLNLTLGQPMTANMIEKLSAREGSFSCAYSTSLMILTGQLSIQDVRTEWRAQIEACDHKNLMFLNSHEHIHMLPVLFPLILELAQEFHIPHIRVTQADWYKPFGVSALIRNTLLQGMAVFNQYNARQKTRSPKLLGLSRSGKLDYDYLETVFSKLQPGQSYELMCHPGRFDSNEIVHPKILNYHDWEMELALLQSPEFQALYEKFGIRLSGYQR